jgi:hypothetical protein
VTVFSLSQMVERDVEGNRSWVAPRGMGGLLICWLGIALICTQKNERGRTPLDVAVGMLKRCLENGRGGLKAKPRRLLGAT